MKEMDHILRQYTQLSRILDYFFMGVLILTPDRKILSVNSAAEIITGCKKSELVGTFCSLGFSDRICNGRCQFEETIKSGRSSGSSEFEVTDESHRRHNITKVVTPIYGPDKHLLGCIELFQDQTAIKDLIERVRHDDRRLKIILDNLDIGILTVDCSRHITFFNTIAESITGFKRETVLGKSCTILFGRDSCDDILLLTETMDDGKNRANKEGEIKTQAGQAIPIRANYMALKNEEGRIVGGLATISDLSLRYQFESAIKDRYTFYDMVGRHPAMQKIFEIIPVVAASDATILIEGATGTGKDVLAKVIHNASGRSGKPLVKVNCAALPDNLLESEMFGYAKGAFTGAERDKPGRFKDADGGTIFLDEIGDLPLSLQAKLLRVLEDQEFYPLGSRKTTRVDVRIISASNQGLERLVQEKRFRGDLFYRLNVMRLELPSLMNRRSDIPLLINHILKRLCATRNTRVKKLSEETMNVLLNHPYPGNIRELENIIEHALIVCQDTIIERKHLPLSLQKVQPEPMVGPENGDHRVEPIGTAEKNLIKATLKKYRWNRGKTADALHMDRSTLWRKMKKYHIFFS